jgi:putative hydrolase of the HAD superfamily
MRCAATDSAPGPAIAARRLPAAVLFDAVGTLLHLREPVGATYARLAAAHGIVLDAVAAGVAFSRALRTMPPMVFPECVAAQRFAAEREWWRVLVRATFAAAGGISSGPTFERCFAALFAHFATAAAWRVVPHAPEVLAALRAAGLRTGIVSNFDHRLPALLDALHLAPWFDTVVLPGDAAAAKPDARIFAVALRRLGVSAEAAVYVGDDAEDDIAGARGAGLQAIDVTVLPDLRALVPAIGIRAARA